MIIFVANDFFHCQWIFPLPKKFSLPMNFFVANEFFHFRLIFSLPKNFFVGNEFLRCQIISSLAINFFIANENFPFPLNLIWFDLIWLIWFDLIWFDLICFDLIWFDLIDLIWFEVFVIDKKPEGDEKNLLWIAVHEIGHSLGLKHSDLRGAIMWPYYQYLNTSDFDLTDDDILGEWGSSGPF